MTTFQPGDRVTHLGVQRGDLFGTLQSLTPGWANVRWDDRPTVFAVLEKDLRHVPVTAEHVGQWARGKGALSGRPRRGIVDQIDDEGDTLLSNDGAHHWASNAVLVASPSPEPPAPAPAFPFVGARAQVGPNPTYGRVLDCRTIKAGSIVTVLSDPDEQGDVRAEREDGEWSWIAARHLRPVPVSPGPDQPAEHEDWRVSGLTDFLVRDGRGDVVAMFHRPEDAARAVADHQDTPALRAEVQRLTGALAEARARQVEDTRELNTLTDDVLKARAERDAARAEVDRLASAAADVNAERDAAEAENTTLRAELDTATTDGLGPPQVEVRSDADGYRLDAYVGGQWTHASISGGDVNRLRQTVAATQALLRARLADEATTDDKETGR